MNNSEYNEISGLSYHELRKQLVKMTYLVCPEGIPMIIKNILICAVPELKQEKMFREYLGKTPICTILEILGKDIDNMECLYVNCFGDRVFDDPRIDELYYYNDIKAHGCTILKYKFLSIEAFESAENFIHEHYNGKYDNILSEYSFSHFYRYTLN